jgi:hypothetical protein
VQWKKKRNQLMKHTLTGRDSCSEKREKQVSGCMTEFEKERERVLSLSFGYRLTLTDTEAY